MIYIDQGNFSIEWYLNIIELILITNDNILDHMRLIIFIINSNINFLESKSILSSEIISLLNLKLFDGTIFLISDNWFQNVDSTLVQPSVAPFNEVKIFAKRISSMLKIGFIESTDKICQLSILPLVLLKIFMKTFLNNFMSQQVMNLLQE
jgi:hypothetical protein